MKYSRPAKMFRTRMQPIKTSNPAPIHNRSRSHRKKPHKNYVQKQTKRTKARKAATKKNTIDKKRNIEVMSYWSNRRPASLNFWTRADCFLLSVEALNTPHTANTWSTFFSLFFQNFLRQGCYWSQEQLPQTLLEKHEFQTHHTENTRTSIFTT